jgi:excisionase family DNA binding protein
MLTTREAAAILHVSRSRVLKLIATGRLPAMKVGRDWFLTPQAVAAYESHPNGRRGGRPRKVA